MAAMVDVMLEEVDRYVTDEQKLVTYGWVSRQLNIPSNIAKRCAAPRKLCAPLGSISSFLTGGRLPFCPRQAAVPVLAVAGR